MKSSTINLNSFNIKAGKAGENDSISFLSLINELRKCITYYAINNSKSDEEKAQQEKTLFAHEPRIEFFSKKNDGALKKKIDEILDNIGKLKIPDDLKSKFDYKDMVMCLKIPDEKDFAVKLGQILMKTCKHAFENMAEYRSYGFRDNVELALTILNDSDQKQLAKSYIYYSETRSFKTDEKDVISFTKLSQPLSNGYNMDYKVNSLTIKLIKEDNDNNNSKLEKIILNDLGIIFEKCHDLTSVELILDYHRNIKRNDGSLVKIFEPLQKLKSLKYLKFSVTDEDKNPEEASQAINSASYAIFNEAFFAKLSLLKSLENIGMSGTIGSMNYAWAKDYSRVPSIYLESFAECLTKLTLKSLDLSTMIYTLPYREDGVKINRESLGSFKNFLAFYKITDFDYETFREKADIYINKIYWKKKHKIDSSDQSAMESKDFIEKIGQKYLLFNQSKECLYAKTILEKTFSQLNSIESLTVGIRQYSIESRYNQDRNHVDDLTMKDSENLLWVTALEKLPNLKNLVFFHRIGFEKRNVIVDEKQDELFITKLIGIASRKKNLQKLTFYIDEEYTPDTFGAILTHLIDTLIKKIVSGGNFFELDVKSTIYGKAVENLSIDKGFINFAQLNMSFKHAPQSFSKDAYKLISDYANFRSEFKSQKLTNASIDFAKKHGINQKLLEPEENKKAEGIPINQMQEIIKHLDLLGINEYGSDEVKFDFYQ